jgi:hypothetical protein
VVDITITKWRRDRTKLFHGDDIISALISPFGKKKSPCRHAGEVADAVVVTLIFNRGVMEKTIPPRSFAVAREEEIDPQYQKNLTWRHPNPKDSIYYKTY